MLLKEKILLDFQCLVFKYITTQQKYDNLYTTLLPWELTIPYTNKKPVQISYLLGQYGIIKYISKVFHTQQLDIKHLIEGKSSHLKLYPISGHVYNLVKAYHELLEFRLVNIQLHSKSSVGC